LRSGLLAVTQTWRGSSSGQPQTVAAKGAPEAIADLCKLGKRERKLLSAKVDAMAARGLRLLAIASGTHKGSSLPETPHGFRFKYVGLVGLADPLRANVPEAVARCREAGIRVVMITGDYPATARAIAAAAGIDGNRVVSGREIENMNDAALLASVADTNVFARIRPQQKLRIVEALKARGEVVGMTGDGVNDAPSLKAAHIGIAMGSRGTDVAREASSIVLLDDDFSSIVKAIALGRRIYDNLRKAMGFILAVHIPIAGMALLPVLAGLPPLLAPVHIAFLEMVIDPVCSLAFEAEGEERNSMKRPPRPPQEPLFNRRMLLWSALQGLMAVALVGGLYLGAHGNGMPENEVRALAFLTLVMVIIGLIFVDRSFSSSLVEAFTRPNRALTVVLFLVFAIMGLALTWPPAASLFAFGPLHAGDLLLSCATAAGLFLLMEMLKGIGPVIGRNT
jgi:Ca2+-transporting ATPase